MLNNITQSTGNSSAVKKQELSSLTKRIDDLEDKLNEQNEKIDGFSEEFATQDLTADSIVTQSVNTNALEGSSAVLSTATINNLTADSLNSTSITASSVKSTSVEAETLSGQITDRQTLLEADKVQTTLASTDELNSSKITANDIVAASITTENLNVADTTTWPTMNVTELTAENANISTLTATSVTSDSIGVTDLSVSDKIIVAKEEVESSNISEATIEDLIVNNSVNASAYYGRYQVNLDPQLSTSDDYYLLKIRKHDPTDTDIVLDDICLEVKNSFTLKLITSHADNSNNSDIGTKGATLAIIHQRTKSQVFLLSEDEDYIYAQICPYTDNTNTNELNVAYHASTGEITDVVTFEYNGQADYDWYYKPVATSEMIMLGDSSSKYQLTVLGKLKAAIGEGSDSTEFDNIWVNHNIYTRSTYNSESEEWNYIKSEDNQYLSSVNEYYDETTESWYTHIEWKSPVDNSEISSITLTDDVVTEYTEPIYDDDGELSESRTVRSVELGTKEKLITLNTLGNYNGQVEVIDSEDNSTTYNPIVKLGVVDEGTWEAGDVTTPNATITKSLNIKPSYITWDETKYAPNLESDYSWVAV